MTNKTTDNFSFDQPINRRKVPALKVHPIVLGEHGNHLFAGGVADMDFKAPPAVLDALQARLDHAVFGYETLSDNFLPAFIDWFSTYHDWHIHENEILRAPNVLNTLATATTLFTDPGDGVIVQPPVFFDFFDIIKENHRQIILNPLKLDHGRYLMDFDDLESKACEPKTKLLYLCNPHNPVGRVWSTAELHKLGDICNRHNVLVVADEMHADLTFNGHKYIPFASLGTNHAKNSITCLSPAKTFNIASCCSSFTIIFDAEKRQAFQAQNSRFTVNKNNAFANVAMQAAYSHGRPWLDSLMSYLESNVELVRASLKDLSRIHLIEPEGTFLVWVDFRDMGLKPDELTKFLREKARWSVTRGHAFGEQGNGFARVNIGCNKSTLNDALDRLTEAVS